MKTYKILGIASLFVVSALGSAIAQNTPQQTPTPDPTAPASNSAAPASMSPDNSGSYATGRPLEMQSKEGFWGHMNPLARKKWVARQVQPIRDRTNELDQLQAKNANDIRDVDSRATAGITKAMGAASAADQHAAEAATRADSANSLAVSADGKTTTLNGTVSNLDQYSKVSSTTLPFVKGRTALSTKAKSNLDEVATTLGTEKGYIVEVQGYSRNGVTSSQAMADSVVRYLVTAHQIPIYRIYRTGLGNQKQVASVDGEQRIVNGVRVTVMHNSLATMGAPATTTTPATGNPTNPTTPATTTTGTTTQSPSMN